MFKGLFFEIRLFLYWTFIVLFLKRAKFGSSAHPCPPLPATFLRDWEERLKERRGGPSLSPVPEDKPNQRLCCNERSFVVILNQFRGGNYINFARAEFDRFKRNLPLSILLKIDSNFEMLDLYRLCKY